VSSISGAIKKRYWEWLQNISVTPGSLAWCHSTDAFALRNIIELGYLEPQMCPVFKEKLLYFFYGRPAYRSIAAVNIGCAAREPVVIVFAQSLATQGIRIYPFDSGAYADNRYDKWMHKKMPLESFELPANSLAPERHVAAFFTSNNAYMNVIAKMPDPLPAGELEVDCLGRFLIDVVDMPADDRRCAVELQVRDVVPFNESVVLAIIIPTSLADAPFLKDFQARTASKIELITYPSNPMKQARDFQVLLEDRVSTLHRKWGSL
jgi:hypothetical protein